MDKPDVEEVALEIERYKNTELDVFPFVQQYDGGRVYVCDGPDAIKKCTEMFKEYPGIIITIFVGNTSILPVVFHEVDKRRKKYFKYEDYAFLQDLMLDVLNYIKYMTTECIRKYPSKNPGRIINPNH